MIPLDFLSFPDDAAAAVLLVHQPDGSPENLEGLLAPYLNGGRIRSVGNRAELERALADADFDAALVDDSPDLLERAYPLARLHAAHPPIPAILIADAPPSGDIGRYLRAGIEDVLTGPDLWRLPLILARSRRRRPPGVIEPRVETLDTLINSMSDGLVIAGPDGDIMKINRAAARLFGCVAESVGPHAIADCEPLLDLRTPEGEPIARQGWPIPRALRGETFFDQEIEITLRSTGRLWVGSFSGGPVPNPRGGPNLALITFRDVTAERETEQERERLGHLKAEFIAGVSHELRTPLASVMGYTEVLLDGNTGELSPLQHEFLRAAYTSAERLKGLLDDLLDVTRMETGRFRLWIETFTPEELVREVVAEMEPSAQRVGVTLMADIAPDLRPIEADPRRLRQALRHLVENALKFTPRGGLVQVLARARQLNELLIEVRDTGMGVHPEDVHNLFQRFYQGRNALGQNRGGTGLGLYVTRMVAEAHGGTAEVESTLNQGSTFRLLLPLTQPESEPAHLGRTGMRAES